MKMHADLTHSVGITSLGTVGIAGVSLLILILTIVTSFADRRFSAQSMELHLNEQRYRQLVESAQVILVAERRRYHRIQLCESTGGSVARLPDRKLDDWSYSSGLIIFIWTTAR